MPDWLQSWWHVISGLAVLAADLVATAHVILRKRDVRAAIGWAGLIWFVPGGGPLLYYLLGINRVARKARRRKGKRSGVRAEMSEPTHASVTNHLEPLARLVHTLSDSPLLPGNLIRPLDSGTEAYTEMLGAIDEAER